MTMRFDLLTLFPDACEAMLSESIIGRARERGILDIHGHQIRDYTENKQKQVDDYPYGGGMGMVMTCQPIYDCFQSIKKDFAEGERVRVIYMSPRGRIFHHEIAKELVQYDRLVFLCGHYEGVDQRVLDEIVDEELSIGDYVVTGGEIPACIVTDAVSRLLDGVLADKECYEDESIAGGLLEYPQYTKPRTFLSREVPEVLLSGDHAKIRRWRLEQSVAITRERRPDLLALHPEAEAALLPKAKKRRSKGSET